MSIDRGGVVAVLHLYRQAVPSVIITCTCLSGPSGYVCVCMRFHVQTGEGPGLWFGVAQELWLLACPSDRPA
jgi:hypothetical protein